MSTPLLNNQNFVRTFAPSLTDLWAASGRVESNASVSSLSDLMNEVGFSPEMILYIANKRMNDIDGQVRSSMAELDATHTESKKVSEQIQALRTLQEHVTKYGIEGGVRLDGEGKFGEKNGMHMIELNGKSVTIREFLEAHDIDPKLLGEKTATHVENPNDPKDWLRLGEDHFKETYQHADLGSLDSKIKNLEEKQKEINTGNELRMVKLQSLMQQRTQILTLATNLLQKLDEGSQSIVRNLA